MLTKKMSEVYQEVKSLNLWNENEIIEIDFKLLSTNLDTTNSSRILRKMPFIPIQERTATVLLNL